MTQYITEMETKSNKFLSMMFERLPVLSKSS